MSQFPTPDAILDVDAPAWRGAARRYRRLQIAQMAILILFGVVAVVCTWLVARTTEGLRDGQRRDQETLSQLNLMNNRLSKEHIRFWKGTAEGERLLVVPSSSRIFAAAAPAALNEIIKKNPPDDPEARKLADQALVLAQEVAAAALSVPTEGIGRFDPKARRFVDLLSGRSEELIGIAEQWILYEQGQLDTAAARATRLTRRWNVVLTSLLGVMTAIAGAVWWRLGRSRVRLVDALEESAQTLKRQAETDQLTGLPGHALFHSRLRAELAEAEAAGRIVSLAVLDLDHFKEINDTFGHQVGDQVLRAVAQELAVGARPGDVVARVGGEEFAWLMPGTNADDAYVAIERLRHGIERATIGPVRTVTISSGVCDTSAADTAAELFRLADGSLYWAKGHGRNLTTRYSPHIVEELSAAERAERLERLMAVNTVRALARAVDAKDPNTRRHSERVGELSQSLAIELGWSERAASELYEAALVHDVGKIGVPDVVLFKTGALTDEEFAQMRQHPALGAQMVSGALSEKQVEWVRGHHERLDGRGYPDGLAGDDVSDGARILALADAWDAMTSPRSYSTPKSTADALAECHACIGSQFWAPAVEALARLVNASRVPAPELGSVDDDLVVSSTTGR